MKKVYIFLVLIVCLFIPDNIFGQNPFRQLKMEYWNTKNGMPNDLILNVYQTKDGFIWTTGYTGLTRFDGASFTSFNTRSVPLLKTDNIESLLHETNDSTLWIPTSSSGLLSYKNGVFNAYLTDSISVNFLGTTDKEELVLQIGRRTQQSYVLFDTHLKTHKSISNPRIIELLKAGKITNTKYSVKDQSGNTWIRFGKLYRLKGGNMNELTPKEGVFPENGFREMYTDSKNRVWLVAFSGLLLWNGQAFQPYPGMEDILFTGSG